MTGTLWEPSVEKVVFLIALGIFALAVGLVAIVARRRIEARVGNALPEEPVIGSFASNVIVLGSALSHRRGGTPRLRGAARVRRPRRRGLVDRMRHPAVPASSREKGRVHG